MSELLDRLKHERGYVLPVHEAMDRVSPELLRRYLDLSGYLLFDREPRALDLKTRYLVLVGITTAVRGDAEGIEWSGRRALENGASVQEVEEAMALAMLPAGVPAYEEAARAWRHVREEGGLLKDL
jgi:alkylhydroperoxidase/carboxymuconolactone decarboxylase family protein YurZ